MGEFLYNLSVGKDNYNPIPDTIIIIIITITTTI